MMFQTSLFLSTSLSPVVFRLWFVVYCLLSVVYRLTCIVIGLLSIVCHPSSVFFRLLTAVCSYHETTLVFPRPDLLTDHVLILLSLTVVYLLNHHQTIHLLVRVSVRLYLSVNVCVVFYRRFRDIPSHGFDMARIATCAVCSVQ